MLAISWNLCMSLLNYTAYEIKHDCIIYCIFYCIYTHACKYSINHKSSINEYKPYHIQWQCRNIHIPPSGNIGNQLARAKATSINTFESTCRTSKGGATIWSFDIGTWALQSCLVSKHKDWHLYTSNGLTLPTFAPILQHDKSLDIKIENLYRNA